MLSFRYTVATIVSVVFAFLNARSAAFLVPVFCQSFRQECASAFSRQMVAQDESSPRVVKVLALHGSEGTGPEFVERMNPLVEALRSQQNVELQLTAITAPFGKGQGFAWWTMPQGVRSFTAQEFEGFETSASLVIETVEKEGPFDLVLGHSQGAILISALLALKRLSTHPSIGYILNGVAMPNPYKDELESLKTDVSPSPRMLFVLGENDKMNPLEIGNKVKTCMEQAGLDVSVCYHNGGHSVPVSDEESVETISAWITDGII